MKRFYLSVVVMLFAHHAFAQCDVTKSVTDSSKLVKAHTEVLYKNEDLENGLRVVHGALSLYAHKGNNLQLGEIDIYSAASDNQPFVFPRQLIIVFSGSAATITLKANSSYDVNVPNLQAKLCTFYLSTEEWKKISEFDINKMVLYDNRSGITLDMYPYKGIFKEQAECINNEMGVYK